MNEPNIATVVNKICFDPEVRQNAKLALEYIVQQAVLRERMRVVTIAQGLAGIGSIDGGKQDIVVVGMTDLLRALSVNA